MTGPIRLLGAVLVACLLASPSSAAELTVLSAGAIEPGIRPALRAFEAATGTHVNLSFATAPQIRARLESAGGAGIDVLIAPPAVLDPLSANGRLAPERVSIGRVGLGVAVRPGAPLPDIASTETLKRAVLEADGLVFNRASTGQYVEGLLSTLGIAAQAAAKTTRYPDGASVMEHLLAGHGREIGFGAMTEIALYRDRALVLVGPLPPALQNFTRYVAAPMADGNSALAGPLLRHLASTASQAAFAAAGIEPAE